MERYFGYPPATPKRVLLVDDEKDLGLIMKEIFKEAGHKFIFATTAKEGMDKFKRSNNLDIAIVDLRLGKDSGLTFIGKAKVLNDRVKFIMISAFGTSETISRARRLGVHHFLHKPLKQERLLDIINR